jgi:hypothetical protein
VKQDKMVKVVMKMEKKEQQHRRTVGTTTTTNSASSPDVIEELAVIKPKEAAISVKPEGKKGLSSSSKAEHKIAKAEKKVAKAERKISKAEHKMARAEWKMARAVEKATATSKKAAVNEAVAEKEKSVAAPAVASVAVSRPDAVIIDIEPSPPPSLSEAASQQLSSSSSSSSKASMSSAAVYPLLAVPNYPLALFFPPPLQPAPKDLCSSQPPLSKLLAGRRGDTVASPPVALSPAIALPSAVLGGSSDRGTAVKGYAVYLPDGANYDISEVR